MEGDMNTIVLLNGKMWKSRIDLMQLAVIWECVRAGTAKMAIIPCVDEKGGYHDLNVRLVDPDKTFGHIVYDRNTPASTIPPPNGG